METLWDFALTRYRREGVAENCLRLQNSLGADVNMLLTAAWLAEQGQVWQPYQVHELIAHCAEWRERCILPLRAVRGYLKTHSLYDQAKALELDAEIHQLHLLDELLRTQTFQLCEPEEALLTNLQTYCDCIVSSQRAIADTDRKHLIAALRQSRP